jgi:hypothetical protein
MTQSKYRARRRRKCLSEPTGQPVCHTPFSMTHFFCIKNILLLNCFSGGSFLSCLGSEKPGSALGSLLNVNASSEPSVDSQAPNSREVHDAPSLHPLSPFLSTPHHPMLVLVLQRSFTHRCRVRPQAREE